MDKEELIEYLRKNLRVVVDLSTDSGYYNESLKITVTLKLEDEVISESGDYVSM